MAWEKLNKPVKGFTGEGCAVRVVEEEDGYIVEFIGTHLLEGISSEEGVCKIKTDPLGNFDGCEKVACSKKCCSVYHPDYDAWSCKCLAECSDDDHG
jgi:hypothetical protein